MVASQARPHVASATRARSAPATSRAEQRARAPRHRAPPPARRCRSTARPARAASPRPRRAARNALCGEDRHPRVGDRGHEPERRREQVEVEREVGHVRASPPAGRAARARSTSPQRAAERLPGDHERLEHAEHEAAEQREPQRDEPADQRRGDPLQAQQRAVVGAERGVGRDQHAGQAGERAGERERAPARRARPARRAARRRPGPG